jgi:hypothetical protein
VSENTASKKWKKERTGEESTMRSFMTLGLSNYQLGNEIKQSDLGRRDNITCKGENTNVCRILEGKPERKRPFGR